MSSAAGPIEAISHGLRIAIEEQRRLRRRALRDRAMVVLCQLALIAATLAAWQFAPSEGLFDPFYISRPSLVLQALHRWALDGTLLRSMLVTLLVALYGFVIGAALGFVAGLILGTSLWLGRILTPIVSALQSIPRLALVPLFILWFGIGDLSKVALVATVVFFLVFAATRAGVAAVDDHLVNALRIMRAKTWQVHLKATLPSAAVWIIEGLRVSIPWALVATVTAEILSANEGIGFLIARSAGQFYTAGVFAGIAVLTLMGVTLTLLVGVIERRLLSWRSVGRP
jgi:NitT/TauT family transport system permease protein